MAEPKTPLEPDKFYHIYNRGINACPIFIEETNYIYFLELVNKHITPIAEIYSWVLMRNHFHFLLKIKSIEELNEIIPNYKTITALGRNRINQQFSNIFNAYSKAFNKKYNRTGSLFEKGFHRKNVNSNDYLLKLIIYIHINPVNHGVSKSPKEYEWSSYNEINKMENDISKKVIDLFDDLENFKFVHLTKTDETKLTKWVGLNV